MQDEFIQLSEVLYRMDKGERFDIEFVTADKKKGTGGVIKKMGNCILYTAFKKTPAAISIISEATVSKSPRHYENSTRNIYDLLGKKTRKVHLRLITRFNGKRVL